MHSPAWKSEGRLLLLWLTIGASSPATRGTKRSSKAGSRALPQKAETRDLGYCPPLFQSSRVFLYKMTGDGVATPRLLFALLPTTSPNRQALQCLLTDSERVAKGTSPHSRLKMVLPSTLWGLAPLGQWHPPTLALWTQLSRDRQQLVCFNTRDSSFGPKEGGVTPPTLLLNKASGTWSSALKVPVTSLGHYNNLRATEGQ